MATRRSPCSRAPPRLRAPTTRCWRRWPRDGRSTGAGRDGDRAAAERRRACVRSRLAHAARRRAAGARALSSGARRVCARRSRRSPVSGGAVGPASVRASGAARWNFPAARGSYLSGAPARATATPSFGLAGTRLPRSRGVEVPEAGLSARGRAPGPVRTSVAWTRWPPRAAQAVAAGIAPNLVVRAWQPGDRMQSSGGLGPKEGTGPVRRPEGAPARRHQVPIVTDADGRIVWVAGHALARRFGVTDGHKVRGSLEFRAVGRPLSELDPEEPAVLDGARRGRGPRLEVLHALPATRDQAISFSTFMTQVETGQVSSVTITGNEISGTLKSNDTFRTHAPTQYEGLANKLIDKRRRRAGQGPDDQSLGDPALLVGAHPAAHRLLDLLHAPDAERRQQGPLVRQEQGEAVVAARRRR